MAVYYLQFEKPIQLLDDKILELEAVNESSRDSVKQITALMEERSRVIAEIYSNLSRWQRVQLARVEPAHDEARRHALDQLRHVGRVQSRAWFVEHIQHSGQVRAERRGERHPLCFSSAKRAQRAFERQVSNTHLVEVCKSGNDLIEQQASNCALPIR